MNASGATGAEAASNATANSIGSASASAAASATASASAEGSENASAASDVDIPTVDPASEQTSNAIANVAGARTDAALDQAKALANTGQDVGGLQVVSVGLVATGLIALVGSLAYQLRNRRA
jgi:allophanate hydrolase subunit 2